MPAYYQLEHNIIVVRGDTWRIKPFLIERTNYDFTGSSVLSQIRKPGGVLVKDLTPTLSFPMLGKILVTLGQAPNVTKDSPVGNSFKWDLELTHPDGEVLTYVYGNATILEDQSHE